MIFIQKQILLLLTLLSGSEEPILVTLKSVCSRELHPLDPQQGATPVPRWGPGLLTDPSPGRGPDLASTAC